MKHAHNERGFALVVAILAIVVIGGLVTAAFTPTLLEQRVAENQRRGTQAFGSAEYGLNESVGNWNTGTWNLIAIGDSSEMSADLAGGEGSYAGWVHRLNADLFIVDMEGEDASSGSRQRVAQFVKLRLLDMDIEAALTAQGGITIGGSAEIEGHDAAPAGWGSCGALTDKSGLRLPDAGEIRYNGSGCNGGSCIDGAPSNIDEDPTITDSTFFNYGDVDWDGLVSMASVRLNDFNVTIEPSLNADGTCRSSSQYNWGEPLDQTSQCANYFPIIYSAGDLHISGRRGQGILLVDGNLDVQGNFEFFGIVIVKGTLGTTGNGGHFNGAVMAANVLLDDNRVLGNALVQYSSCSVTKALLAGSPGAPIRSRGWLYAY